MLLDMSSSHQDTGRKIRSLNVGFPGCILLTNEENDMLRNECDLQNYVIKAAGVAQLYFSAPSVPSGRHDHWALKKTGVVCFIKDNSACGFFIRLFDMEERAFSWEQELFIEIKYEPKMGYFHVFEADTCMAGLNFSHEEEARRFNEAVQLKLNLRRAKVEEKKRASANNPAAASRVNADGVGFNNNNNNNNFNKYPNNSSNDSLIHKKLKLSKKEKKKKIMKADISEPTNFVHIKHVGLNKATCAQSNLGLSDFNIDIHDLDLKLYEKAGISEKHLQDPRVQRNIKKVLEQQVQSNQLSNDTLNAITRRQPPPPPARIDSKPAASLPPPASGRNQLPTRQPPPPNQHLHGRSPAPPKPNRVAENNFSHKSPPPVPQSMQVVQPVRLPQPQSPQAALSGAVPPPPPPPPPPPLMERNENVSKTPSSGSMSSSSCNNAGGVKGRDALLDQIRAGRSLKPIDHSKAPIPCADDGRDALLEQIRAGKSLKPASSRPQRPEVPATNDKVEKEVDILTAALARAMADRNKAVQSDDSDTSDSEEVDDDDEWDD